MNVTLHPMDSADWPAVRAIYLEGIVSGVATFETSAPDWPEWDQNHLPLCRWVARAEGQVVGWAALSPVSKRKCYAGVAEVSIYIAAPARGQGVGRILLETLLACADANGLWTLQATIMAVNSASRRLHASCGFREVGYRERIAQLHGVWHDTVIMERRSKNF